jgi:hypothetical protein
MLAVGRLIPRGGSLDSHVNKRSLRALGWSGVMAALCLGWLVPDPIQAQTSFGSQPAGSPAGEQSITITSPAGGQISKVMVLTMGASGPNLDFTKGVGANSCENTLIAPGGACTESIIFTPTAPGLRMGAVVLSNADGQVLGTTYISGTGTGGVAVFMPGSESTFAGIQGLSTAVNDGGPATSAEPDQSAGVAMDGAGNLYIADSLHNRIRLVCSENPPPYVTTCAGAGTITTIVGNGQASLTGDPGLASAEAVDAPQGVALDGAANLYGAAGGSAPKVEELPLGCASSSCAKTVGGGFRGPTAVAVDRGGDVYVADAILGKAYRVPAGCSEAGCTVPLPGSCAHATETAIDPSGHLNIADEGATERPACPH